MNKKDKARVRAIEAQLGRKFNKVQRKAILMHEKMHDVMAWKHRLHQMTLGEVYAMLAKGDNTNHDLHEYAGDTNAPTPVSAWITTLKEVSHVPLIAGFIALLEEKYQPTDGLHADEFERLADEWKAAYASTGNAHPAPVTFVDEHPSEAPKSEWMQEAAKQLGVPFVGFDLNKTDYPAAPRPWPMEEWAMPDAPIDLPMAKTPLAHDAFMPDAPAPGLGKQMQKRMAKPVSPRVKRYKRKSLARVPQPKDDGPTAAS